MEATMTLMTSAQLRSYLNISRSTLYRMIQDGIPCIGEGRLRRFDRDEVVQWYEERFSSMST